MHKLYSLKSIVNFLLVFLVKSYAERIKGSKKGNKITFFQQHRTFPLTIMSHLTKNSEATTGGVV